MRKEVELGNQIFIIVDGIVQSVKAPAEESGLGYALFCIGMTEEELYNRYK